MGLLPAALSTRIGAQSQQPLAIVVIGGIAGWKFMTVRLIFCDSRAYLVEIGGAGETRKEAELCGEIANADAMIVYSHGKGHGHSGWGGAIKNIGKVRDERWLTKHPINYA